MTPAEPAEPFAIGEIYPILPGKLSFTVHYDQAHTAEEIARHSRKFFFSSVFQGLYVPFCLDFGPVDLGVVHEFCEYMSQRWNDTRLAKRELVYYSEPEIDLRTNAAFLLAAFLVTRLGLSPEEAWAPFSSMPLCAGQEDTFVPFRDATYNQEGYELSVKSCLEGLARGMALGWYDPKTFDVDSYNYLADPSVADLHAICPKFCAFRGPTAAVEQLSQSCLPFTPAHYLELFKAIGVTGVVRLNEADTYDREAFTRAGVNHHDVFFDDCTTPSLRYVASFLDAAERETGMVAVHCFAGLGRTGCMIGCYLIKHFGFSAAAALGWLRIVRPGSVIGAQQEFLHHFEASLAQGDAAALDAAPPGPELSDCKRMGEDIARAQAERAHALRPARLRSPGSLRSPSPLSDDSAEGRGVNNIDFSDLCAGEPSADKDLLGADDAFKSLRLSPRTDKDGSNGGCAVREVAPPSPGALGSPHFGGSWIGAPAWHSSTRLMQDRRS